jgi:hypothetical protein
VSKNMIQVILINSQCLIAVKDMRCERPEIALKNNSVKIVRIADNDVDNGSC